MIRSHFGSSYHPASGTAVLATMSNNRKSVFDMAQDANAERRAIAVKRRKTTPQKEEAADEASIDSEAVAKVVERNIARKIMPVPAAAIDVVLIDGKTMRSTMIADRMELLQGGKQRADPDYFGRVKKMYLAALAGIKNVEVRADADDLPDGLELEIKRARAKQRRDRKQEGVVHWLWQRTTPLNQRSVVELADLLVCTHAAHCLKQATMTHDIALALIRLGNDASHADEFAPILPLLQSALQTIYHTELKNDEDYDFASFWAKYEKTAKLFLDKTMMDMAVDAKINKGDCTTELTKLAVSCPLGTVMFMQYCPFVVARHVNTFMRAEADKIVNANKITGEMINTAVSKMIVEAERLSMDKVVKDMVFEIKFAGTNLEMPTSSAVELARLHVAAAVKTAAESAGKLNEMKHRKAILLIESYTRTEFEDVPALEVYKDVRENMDRLMRKLTFNTARALPDFLDSKRCLWWSQDPTFCLEVTYFRQMSGALGGKLLIDQAIGMLPDRSLEPSYPKVLGKLRDLVASTAWLFSDAPSRGSVTALTEIISGMHRGDPPSAISFPAGTRMAEASLRLGNFCFFADESDGSMSFSSDALESKLTKLDVGIQLKSITELSLVSEINVFKWMLDKKQCADFEKKSKEANEIVMAAGAPGSVTAADAGAIVQFVAAHAGAKAASAQKKHAASAVPKKKGKASKAS